MEHIENGIFGHHTGQSGVAYEEGYISDISTDISTVWLLSTQRPDLYRGNGVDYTSNSSYGFSSNVRLAINDGIVGSTQNSDWSCAELLIFNKILELNEIKCIENSLTLKYDLPFPSVGISEPTSTPSNTPSMVPSGVPTLSPSFSPTTCYDDGLSLSDDGYQESVEDEIRNLQFVRTVNDSKVENVTIDFKYYRDPLDFDGVGEVELRCSGLLACGSAHIVLSNNVISNVLCDGSYSCSGARITVTSLQNTQIICNGPSSCEGATIYIHLNTNDIINIDCGDTTSCKDLQITINGYGTSYTSCIGLNACDGLYIDINPERYKTNFLNMHSWSNNVIFSNGFGLEEIINVSNNTETIQYVECNNKYSFIEWDESLNSTDLLEDIIYNEFNDGIFPCQNLTVQCFGNDTNDVTSCDMQYEVIQSYTPLATNPLATCYWVSLSDILSIQCIGECLTSPTEAPTLFPTQFPTKPSVHPTHDPTSDPTIDPTIGPTSKPTLDPTVDPTTEPTTDPTINPTTDPSIDPTKDPTVDPTTYPTIDPTNNPTSSPSAAPSIAPITPPTNAPTTPPTNAPSESPTRVPSASPTSSPTHVPTYSPSAAPTRLPTTDINKAYDTYINIEYAVSNLSATNKTFIVHNTNEAVGKMEEIIESNYFLIDVLTYQAFFVNILEINGKYVIDDISTNAEDSTGLTEYDLDINNIEQKAMSLNCRIECDKELAGFILQKTSTDRFETGIQNDFRKYFNNKWISFDIVSTAEAMSKHISTETEDPIALILSIIVVSFGAIFSLLSFIYNKLPSTKVDNAVVFMPLLISLNLYDFLSDVNLCIVIITTASTENVAISSLLFWLAVMSVLFILLPFSSNLLYAMRIRKQKTIRDNPSARAYFGKHLAQFILMCVFCAGTYPVLGLTSSRLFGLEWFNTGLLSSELHELSKIKIRSTIYMENVPQLLIQILYTVSTSQLGIPIQTATILAFVASSLSVVASVIIYQAQKDMSEEFIVEKYFIRLDNSSGISNNDRNTIKFCKGLKEHLGEALCQVFNISNKSIEIGFVTVSDHGLIIHLQHQIYKDELDTLRTKLLSGSNIAMASSGYVINITPNMYIEHKFELHRDKILNALVEHFRMTDKRKEFKVSYHKHFEEANNYNDDNIVDDVEGDDIEMVNALRQQINKNVMSTTNMFATTTQRTPSIPVNVGSDQENKEEQMVEMTPMGPTNIGVSNNKAFNEFLQLFQQFVVQHSNNNELRGGTSDVALQESTDHNTE